MKEPSADTHSIESLIAERNRVTDEIERLTVAQENTPGALQLLREFLNWHGWLERQGHDDESREELARIVDAAQKCVSSPNHPAKET